MPVCQFTIGSTLDDWTGLDYADQRFYASSYRSFNSADPYRASAGAAEPGSWNRYAYVTGDPINLFDPRGRLDWDRSHYDSTPSGGAGGGLAYGTEGASAATDSSNGEHEGALGEEGGDLTDVGDSPLTLRERFRNLDWMKSGWESLNTFNANEDCSKLLSTLGLTSKRVQDCARGGAELSDIRSYINPAEQKQFKPGADFTALPSEKRIVYNMANFWQSTNSQMLGTLLHELAHPANPALMDPDVAAKIGVSVSQENTSSISKEPGAKCFP